MQATTTTAPPRRGLLGPLATGVALAGAGAYVAAVDPAQPGAAFPLCPFHRLTGLWCPGCGLTRGTHQLLHGHVGAALSYNLFTPLVLGAIATAWILWMRRSVGRAPVAVAIPGWLTGVALPITLVVYGVARNLPGFRALAP